MLMVVVVVMVVIIIMMMVMVVMIIFSNTEVPSKSCNTTVEAISRRYGYKAEGCRGGLGVKKR